MNAQDWALIIYTLFLQSAVGIYAVSRAAVWKETERVERMRFLWLAAGLGIAGVLASFLHLGYPGNALLTMSNLGSSWLSREILLTVCFGAAGLISLFLEHREVGDVNLRNGWAVLTGIVGIALVYVMSMIYRSTAFPAWEHVSTTVGFLATAGVIGSVVVFGRQCCRKGETASTGMTILATLALALLTVEIAAIVTRAVYLGSAGAEAQATAALLMGQYGVLYVFRVILLLVGAAIFVPLVWRMWAEKRAAVVPKLAGAMVALVALGELTGRVLFFATRVKIGL